MRKKVGLFLVAVVMASFLTGCAGASIFSGAIKGNGKITRQEKTVESFSGISLSSIGDVSIRISDEFGVAVSTDENMQENVKINVIYGILDISIESKNGKSISPTSLKIEVAMPDVKTIDVSGAGKVTIGEGKGTDITIYTSGVGSIDAQKYQVNTAVVDISGVGNVKVWVDELLSGDVSGTGSLQYKGNPKVDVDKSGMGSVKPL